MKDTDFQEGLDGLLDTMEHIVDTIRETGKRIIDSVMESDPVVTMERWVKEEIPDAIHVIQDNGGWAKFFSLMWNVQEMCCNVLKMADVVKWVQDNLPKGANRAVMLALPPQLVTSDRTGYDLHYYVSYLDGEDKMVGDKVLYCHCYKIDSGLKNAFGDKDMIVFN